MHIHPSAIGPALNNTYAAGNERAAAAQRAEDRKRLLRAVQTADPDSTPAENLLIGQWLDSGRSSVLPDDVYHSASEGKDSDFG